MKIQAFFSASLLFIVFAFVNNFNPAPVVEVAAKPTKTVVIEEPSFAEFLSHFEKTDLPFSVTLSDLNKAVIKKPSTTNRKKGKGKYVNPNLAFGTKYIPELALGLGFSRMGPPIIEPVARFFPNDKMVAVVYKTSRGSRYQSYNLVIYDTRGNTVFPKKEKDRLLYNGYAIGLKSSNKTITCQIDESGHLWKNTFKNIYDEKVSRYEQNGAVAYNLLETEIFKIDSSGELVAVKEYPDLSRASMD